MDAKEYILKLCEDFGKINLDIIDEIVCLIMSSYNNNGKVYIMGNGGSASTASHLAQGLNDAGISAFSLADNTAVTTALANDIGYDKVYSDQISRIAKEYDCVILISGSGNSKNIVEAYAKAYSVGTYIVALLGFGGGRIKKLIEETNYGSFILVSDDNYGRIEDVHLSLCHIISLSIKDILNESKRC